MFILETNAKAARKMSVLTGILFAFTALGALATMHVYVKPRPAPKRGLRVFGFLVGRRGLAILTAACLAATAAHAEQPRIPPEMLGKWCSHIQEGDPSPGKKWTEIYIEWTEKCGEDGIFVVKQNEWRAWESGCRFTSVRTVWDPTIIATTKTLGVWVSHIKAKCGGEGCTWRSNFVLYVAQGTLHMSGRNTKEECKG
jgi:hypothetical protein